MLPELLQVLAQNPSTPPLAGVSLLKTCQLPLLAGISITLGASLVAQMIKNLPAEQETWVQPLGQEDPLEKGMATHSSILAWESQGQRSLAGYSPWGH